MKRKSKPLSMTRDAKPSIQIFRTAELRGVCFSRIPRYCSGRLGGVYREKKGK